MPDPILTYRGTIYPWHCDHMGHMNVMWYVGKFDEATWHLFASAGLTGKRMRAESLGMAAVEQRIEYKRELLAGDLITIRSWFQEVREKVILQPHAVKELIEPSEVAGVVAFLAGPDGKMFTGAPVTLDQGWTAR